VDADLKVLVWSEGCVDSTQLSQVVVQDRDIAELPWMSEASRNNVVDTLRTLVASDGSESVPARREMLLGLMPSLNGELSAPTILLRMTATRVVTSGNQVLVFCVGREVSMQHKPASILLLNFIQLINFILFKTLVGKSLTQSGSRQRTLRPANEHSVLTTQVDAGLVSLYSASQAQNGQIVREQLPLFSASGSDISSLTETAASVSEDTSPDAREDTQTGAGHGQQLTADSAQKLSLLAKYI
jgi:hypothetical protein